MPASPLWHTGIVNFTEEILQFQAACPVLFSTLLCAAIMFSLLLSTLKIRFVSSEVKSNEVLLSSNLHSLTGYAAWN